MVDQPISPISPYFFEFSTSRPPPWSTSPFLRFLHISSNSRLPDHHHGRPAHFSDFSIFLRILDFPTPMVVDQPISPISPYFFEFSTSRPPWWSTSPFLR